MKNFLAFIAVLALGYMIITSLNNNVAFPKYGEADVSERVSQAYIDRSVTEDPGDITFGESTDLESGPANIVTAIVADYRSFDTLGEVTVLFVSSLGVALLLGGVKRKRLELDFHPNFMLKVGSRALFGIILMTGVYVAIHGHLTPGGGFPGGAMIASSILLLYLADDEFRAKIKGFKMLESVAGSIYVLIGLTGLLLINGGFFLENFLDNGVIGTLFSAGIIPIVYVLIGLKVGSEISGIIDNFLTEEAV
jgi:multicomponent Na+:H+ antiporter subunit B